MNLSHLSAVACIHGFLNFTLRKCGMHRNQLESCFWHVCLHRSIVFCVSRCVVFCRFRGSRNTFGTARRMTLFGRHRSATRIGYKRLLWCTRWSALLCGTHSRYYVLHPEQRCAQWAVRVMCYHYQTLMSYRRGVLHPIGCSMHCSTGRGGISNLYSN